jgi:hypothetical protein
MNRKLQHTMSALTATAAMLGLMLLAGAPSRPAEPALAAMVATSATHAVAIDEATGNEAATTAEAPADAAHRSHVRRARTALALPYFSVAQGLRRVTGS